MLTEDMKRIIREYKIGFVATVCADGTPNLSPKATFVVLDHKTLLFSNLRSPQTLENIKHQPTMAINFVDTFLRRGFRVKGQARYIERGADSFGELLPLFDEWADLQPRMQGIFRLEIEEALDVTSPAYDMGATEEDLKSHWKAHYLAL